MGKGEKMLGNIWTSGGGEGEGRATVYVKKIKTEK